MQNALTVDVEDWYHTLDFHFPMEEWGQYEDRVENSLRRLTDLFDRYHVKATFFVLGVIAQKHPRMIAELAEQGHEIGSHGLCHRLVYDQDEAAFREDVRSSKQQLEDIIGQPVESFRASTWSISKDTLWALRVLEEEGFHYDSSIQPFKTYLSGIQGAPVFPFHPAQNGKAFRLLEFPPTTYTCGKLVMPFSGGFYLRAMPLPVIRHCLKAVNKRREGMVYVHPWEVDTEQPRLRVPPLVQLSHYYHIGHNLEKVEKLLQTFSFVPVRELLRDKPYPSVELSSL
ncbi:MAG: DUF3473 domain-containing protein [Ethanoligenens sp.]